MDLLNYLLSWEDDFDYPDSQLDANRTSQHGPPGHTDYGRYRDNAKIIDGVLELQDGQES